MNQTIKMFKVENDAWDNICNEIELKSTQLKAAP